MTIILGSESPRRKEILQFFSIPFIQCASDFDEESIPYQPDDFEKLLSEPNFIV